MLFKTKSGVEVELTRPSVQNRAVCLSITRKDETIAAFNWAAVGIFELLLDELNEEQSAQINDYSTEEIFEIGLKVAEESSLNPSKSSS